MGWPAISTYCKLPSEEEICFFVFNSAKSVLENGEEKLNGLYEHLTFCLIRSDRLKHKIVDLSCDKLRKNTDNFPKYLTDHCVQGKRVEAEPS